MATLAIHGIRRNWSRSGVYGRALMGALVSYLALRLLCSLVPLIGLVLPPVTHPANPGIEAQLSTLENQSAVSRYLLAPWYRFDSMSYVSIAENGYLTDTTNASWPPLYPMLIWLVARLVRPTLLAALVVSNLAAIAALTLLYVLVAETWEEPLARKSLLWLILFPSAFFLLAAYSESLYLALSLACLLAARRQRWLLAGVFGALAALTRYQGILIALPILVEGWLAWRSTPERPVGKFAPVVISVALIGSAWLGFAVYIHYGLGYAWPWEVQTASFAQRFAWPWQGLWTNVKDLLGLLGGWPIFDYPRLFDLAAAVLAIVLFMVYRKKMPLSYWAYAVVLLLLALVKVNVDKLLVSTTRYLLTAFPLFVALGLWLKSRAGSLIWFGLSLAGQCLLLASFYWWAFVG